MIEVMRVRKSFGNSKDGEKNQRAVDDLDLTIQDGEFFCLLGPSGCGKTTLLRLIAGLENSESGLIKIAGKDVTNLAPHLRGCAMVFQNYALWPHLTVAENITYGLEVQKKAKEVIGKNLEASLHTYQLDGLQARYPHQLSGGQQQRVALARAMVMEPRALLMDEPLSNLDATLRKNLRRDLIEFHRRAGGTVLYVTHDQEEAMALGDRIAIMKTGKIMEIGSPRELYLHPKTLDAALFLGDMNVLRGKDAKFWGRDGILCIRPENVRVHIGEEMTTENLGLMGTLSFGEFMGSYATMGFETPSGRILTRTSQTEAHDFKVGTTARLHFPLEHQLWYQG